MAAFFIVGDWPLWLGQYWLERGGRVFEPKSGLKSRALTKSEKSPTKSNDTTEPILPRPALANRCSEVESKRMFEF